MARDIAWLQERLRENGSYTGPVDGQYTQAVKDAIIKALKDGPDHKLEQVDVDRAAIRMQVEPACVWTVWDVEASGRPFINGMPTILFEPHRFSKATKHRFDQSHPKISSLKWNKSLYPGSQAGRWEQLVTAVGLDVDAGFASASYGGFQILGENYLVCKAANPWSFAWQEAQTEADQLEHFISFVLGNRLDQHLRNKNWAAFAKGYNGTSYRENKYDEKLAAAYKKRAG